jgi:hypothetical protein
MVVTSETSKQILGSCAVAAVLLGCSGVRVESGPDEREAPAASADEPSGVGSSSATGTGSGQAKPAPVASEGASTSATGFSPSGPASAPEPLRYSGKGFIVHEWGTDTVVVGSDGSLQRGLHHEEEDLPAFVYDRLKAGPLLGTEPSVTIKMETPVTYFYSDRPLTVEASVSFPKGVLTQWYPEVTAFAPSIAAPGAVNQTGPASYADPALDPYFPFAGAQCRERFGVLSGGRLNWGKLEVLSRAEAAPAFPQAPLEQFSWSYARDVDSNALRMPSGEAERFLFYRGLGEFDLPVKVSAAAGGKITLGNAYAEAIPSVFVLNVNDRSGAFNEHPQGIAEGATLSDVAPSLDGAATLDSYADELGERVTATLDAAGLFHDEAQAMVNTWKRQWFRTPGIRVLYLIPQSWTDQSIPLSILPAPDETRRVMLIRVELITPEQEAADVAAAKAFDSTPDVAAAHFVGLGRFEEPRLRRALTLQPSSAGSAYLSQIQSANSTVMSGE